MQLSAFTDAHWAGNALDRRSTGRYSVDLGSNLVFWSAKKQPTGTRSSTEAEYKALANAVAEVVWLMQLLEDLNPHPSIGVPVLWCNNVFAISRASNPVFHTRTKTY